MWFRAAGNRDFVVLSVLAAWARWVECDSAPESDFSRPHKAPGHDPVDSCTALQCREPSLRTKGRWKAEMTRCDGAAARKLSRCGSQQIDSSPFFCQSASAPVSGPFGSCFQC